MTRYAVVVAGMLIAGTCVRGGSLAPDPVLGKISQVRLSVSPGLSFEPIPGLDIEGFTRELRVKCEEALTASGLQLSEAAETFLLTTVTHAWDDDDRSEVALLLELKIFMPTRPIGQYASSDDETKRWVVIWEEKRLLLTRPQSVQQKTLEALSDALEELVHDRKV